MYFGNEFDKEIILNFGDKNFWDKNFLKQKTWKKTRNFSETQSSLKITGQELELEWTRVRNGGVF